MKTARPSSLVFFSMAAIAGIFCLSCTNIAKFTIDHPAAVSKTQFTNVVVVPIPSVNRMDDSELLGGERVFSDFAERVFKTKTCRVVRADQVRKELKIAPYEASVSLVKMTQFYKPDGVLWIEFANLKRSGGWGNAANGYIEGDMIVHLLDRTGQPLLTCSGYVHAENGSGFSPGFDTMLSQGFGDLEPKLLGLLE
jgi:hypothetical protein